MYRSKWVIILILISLLIGIALWRYFSSQAPQKNIPQPITEQIGNHNTNSMKISSPAFKNNESIPAKFTCSGEGVNPKLDFIDVPTSTKSLALVVDDPDAPGGTFIHWLVWNISPSIASIKENSVPEGTIQGANSINSHSYVAPCPPSGTHRYQFRLYALDIILSLDSSSKISDLEKAIEGHVVERTKIIGLYKK